MSKHKPPNLPRSVVENLISEWVRGKLKRDILKAAYFDELTIEQLAERFQIGDSTVKRKLDAAHTQLYRHLSPEIETGLNQSEIECE